MLASYLSGCLCIFSESQYLSGRAVAIRLAVHNVPRYAWSDLAGTVCAFGWINVKVLVCLGQPVVPILYFKVLGSQKDQ